MVWMRFYWRNNLMLKSESERLVIRFDSERMTSDQITVVIERALDCWIIFLIVAEFLKGKTQRFLVSVIKLFEHNSYVMARGVSVDRELCSFQSM